MATVKCTKCHTPMQTTKSPGELEDCPKCRAVFEIPFTGAKFYHHSIPGMMPQESSGAPVLAIIGTIVLVVGIILMGYFGMAYDTTVYAGGGDYVHNAGKLSNRTTGMIFGGFISIVGTGFIIGELVSKK